YGSKTYSDTIVSRVRPSGRSKSQSSVDSYRHATRSGHTESISDSNSGIEWSTSDVSVTDRAYVSCTTITKGPAAGCRTNTNGSWTSKAHRFPDLSRPRTSNRRNGKLRIYCYRDVSGRCHVDNISGSNTCCERSLAGVGVGRDASGARGSVTKSPVASRYTNSTCCMCGKTDGRANLGWIRTGCNGNTQLHIDGQ